MNAHFEQSLDASGYIMLAAAKSPFRKQSEPSSTSSRFGKVSVRSVRGHDPTLPWLPADIPSWQKVSQESHAPIDLHGVGPIAYSDAGERHQMLDANLLLRQKSIGVWPRHSAEQIVECISILGDRVH